MPIPLSVQIPEWSPLSDPIQFERVALGAMLLDNELLTSVLPISRREQFELEAHRAIYDVLRAYGEAGRTIDVVILAEELVRQGLYDAVGGDEALNVLIAAVDEMEAASLPDPVAECDDIQGVIVGAMEEIVARHEPAATEPAAPPSA